MNTQGGFTLIELMIVISIIAILAAIAIPAYQDYVVRVQATECVGLIAGSKAAVSDHFLTGGTMPADNAAAGMAEATSISGNYVSQVEISNGTIACTFSSTAPNRANAVINGATMTWTPIPGGGSLTWECSSTMAPRFLPQNCR